MPRIDESIPFRPVRIAVLTVSDTRDAASDKSGDILVARLEAAGHLLADRRIVWSGAGPVYRGPTLALPPARSLGQSTREAPRGPGSSREREQR